MVQIVLKCMLELPTIVGKRFPGPCELILSKLYRVDAPVTQSFVIYIFLALIYGCVLLYRGQRLRVSWYWYILLGFVDVEGNYLVVKAYQYTSITSVTLLDCWTIPWVMILTRLFIKTKYKIWQYCGAVICIAGLIVVFFSDSSTTVTGGSKPILGDVLVIAGTIFYALSNVGEEFCVKKRDRVEVVAMLGIFGALISGIQLLIFERKELESLDWSFNIVILFLGFGVSMFAFYTFVPFLLQMSGATLFNLSLLTSDMWAVIIRIFFYHQGVNWLYFLSLGIVIVGLTIYSLYTDQDMTTSSVGYENDQIDSIPYAQLNQEREASLESINVNQN
ncbi:uncharacterized protein LOC131072111 isoform X2 [Cryptomeria japonica]|uniref:uncharacterized protein LOC131072111 isoform X2 n=1 Tax=Cryptomeria japonica TaxID=3369 RepID=UPI0027DA6AD7|nr:uncharacterized protein LOC131072111 isoform X2 [Cryptomeria japonica]